MSADGVAAAAAAADRPWPRVTQLAAAKTVLNQNELIK